MSIRTAAITNLGCRVNQAEMEAVARMLSERGVTLVGDRRAAQLHVVNTCTVTAVADQKSRQAVRRAARANPGARLVVTGCAVQVAPEAFSAAHPAAEVVPNDAKDTLLIRLDSLLGAGRDRTAERAGSGDRDRIRVAAGLPTLTGVEPIGGVAEGADLALLPDAGRLSAGTSPAQERTRAFVKVQDGCSFHCTYCIIPRARGPERSVPPDGVLAEVRRAVAAGRREIVLTGVNIGTYDGGASERGSRGSHRSAALTLPGLVRRILAETAVERIRLSSIEPQHVDGHLLDAWASAPDRCLPHLHIPLQSGDDGVLRRMGRRYDTAAYAGIVVRARRQIPGLALHADVIAGFPTEDDAAWERGLAFIRSLSPAGIHAFRYSPRSGTPATRMAGQVGEATRKRRTGQLLALAAELRAGHAAAQVGRDLRVLFESRLRDGRWVGHAENNVLVAIDDPDELENVVGIVRVSGVDPAVGDRVVGSIVRRIPPPEEHAARQRPDRPNRRAARPGSIVVPNGGAHGI